MKQMKKVLLFFAVGLLIALAANYIIIPLLAGLFSGEYMFQMLYGAVMFLIVVTVKTITFTSRMSR